MESLNGTLHRITSAATNGKDASADTSVEWNNRRIVDRESQRMNGRSTSEKSSFR